jgi:peptidoglycan hydrolase-like protein with peptidoglycan-binding domain
VALAALGSVRLLVGLGLLVASCTAPQGLNVPIAPGGSVTDYDRGAWGQGSPDTGQPAGARDTIGAMGFGGTDVVRPAPLPPLHEEVAGTPEEIRRLQRALAERGYYHGPINGLADASLADALRRYRADTGGRSPFEEEAAPRAPHASAPAQPPPPPDGGISDGGR